MPGHESQLGQNQAWLLSGAGAALVVAGLVLVAGLISPGLGIRLDVLPSLQPHGTLTTLLRPLAMIFETRKSQTRPSNERLRRLEDCIHLKSERSEKEYGNVGNRKRQRFIIFLVTGNPGLIEFYREFLALIHHHLSERNDGLDFDFEVYGRSLRRFEVSSVDDQRHSKQEQTTSHSGDLTLTEQIDFVEGYLFDLVNPVPTSSKADVVTSSSSSTLTGTADEAQGAAEPSVILIGHSVGAYITMELIQRHRQRLESQAAGSTRSMSSVRREPRIISGICLFPTVVDIARSPRGRLFTRLCKPAHFPATIAVVAKALTTLLPRPLLLPLLRAATGFTPHAARVTAAFLSRPRAVRAALAMAADEMRSITRDPWGAEVWGAAHPSATGAPRPRLFFLFGEKDHWVADETREEIIRTRGGEEDWRPRMEIDDQGTPHGFSIAHAETVAERCCAYVEEVVRFQKEGERADE